MNPATPVDAREDTARGRPILVTGAHRAGTTWVGRMLALPRTVAYVHEPFNVDYYGGFCSARPRHWFEYVRDENAERFAEPLGRTLRLQSDFRARMDAARGLRERLRVCRSELRFAAARMLGARALVKDPLAVFSAPWISDRFDAEVVVLVRHPAAFVGSLKKAGWPFDFREWSEQPLLMRDRLAGFRDEIAAATRGELDLVDQGALLWKGIYAPLAELRRQRPDWHFVRHEDLARDPRGGFEALYRALGLPFTDAVVRHIDAYSARGNAGANPASPFEVRRDSRATVDTWKQRLESSEAERVRRATADWWPAFYDASEW